MSMDLKSESGREINPSGSAWSFFLELAEAYGWKSAGTASPQWKWYQFWKRSRAWDGGYASNDGQTVAREDAAAMADALSRVLADPDGDEKQREVNRKLDEEVRALAKRRYGITLAASKDDSIAAPTDLQALIEFLRSGSFQIW